jgi:predicted nuclease of predicted toxin-antitoxin system
MKFVADESVERQIVDGLKKAGHEVWYVAEQTPSASDDFVLSTAARLRAVLVTADKDFGEFRKLSGF